MSVLNTVVYRYYIVKLNLLYNSLFIIKLTNLTDTCTVQGSI